MASTAADVPFAANTRCLAFHGPLLYESKILKVFQPENKPANDDTTTTTTATTTSTAAAGANSVHDIPEELRGAVAYLIHYKGWKSSWDEWLPQERVLRWSEENLRIQKELKAEALAALRKKKDGSKHDSLSGAAGAGDGGTQPGKRRAAASDHVGSDLTTRSGGATGTGTTAKKTRRDADDRDDDGYGYGYGLGTGTGGNGTGAGAGGAVGGSHGSGHLDVNILVPDVLKSVITDDWENVTKNAQVVDLPRSPSVKTVLDEFRASYITRRLGNAETEILDEVLSGIELYFDKSLGSILLYRFERQQYLEVTRKYSDRTVSHVYGPEHLLRLFVALPGLLNQTHMDQQSLNVLKSHIEEILRFLAKNQQTYFINSYINTTPAYEAVSRGL
ncbi:MRG-domain-containing protein [Lipomyces japonicus]|uniref:MRG-domain-containing protein n=1 Tax=Lipomyces japonicus TaxID=56871 RepID=UPI0034CD298F